MSEIQLPVPGSGWGLYPERKDERAPGWANATRLTPSLLSGRQQQQFLRHLRRLAADSASLTRIMTLARQEEVLKRLQRQAFTPELAAEVLLRIGNACHLELGVRPAEVQFLAAWVILRGGLAQIGAGEGKTIAVAMAGCAAALAGVPVHVFTAGDYLAERDAAGLAPLFEHFGLTVACVTKLHSFEQRRHAYRADVTYCTAREVGFDYLRDLATPTLPDSPGQTRGISASSSPDRALRGLCMGILDDADTTLLDEARSPMIISRPAPSGASLNALEQAMLCARRLEPGKHYRLDTSIQNVQLTPEGKARLDASQADSAAHWRNPRQREELVDLALYAMHLLARDRDYVLLSDGVALIDPTTGEPDAGRDWNRGLVQMLALKEGVTPPPINETVAHLSLHSLFARYHWLGGASSNLTSARLELAVFYGLRITRIARQLPERFKTLPTRIFSQRFLVWRAVVQRVRELQAAGRPVLIGTDSIADAEALGAVLAKNGLSAQLLHGRQDSIEHSALARAGRPLRITIAAQSAGHGTHIELAPGLGEIGGLHVICCTFSGVRRLQAQMLGRAGRRGQPGSGEVMLCLDQGLLAQHLARSVQRFARRLVTNHGQVPSALAGGLVWYVHRLEEFSHRWTLWKLRREDRSWKRRMEAASTEV